MKSHQGGQTAPILISSCVMAEDMRRRGILPTSLSDSFASKLVVTWLSRDEIGTPSQGGQRLEISHFIRKSDWRRSRPLITVNVVIVRHVKEIEKSCNC